MREGYSTEKWSPSRKTKREEGSQSTKFPVVNPGKEKAFQFDDFLEDIQDFTHLHGADAVMYTNNTMTDSSKVLFSEQGDELEHDSRLGDQQQGRFRRGDERSLAKKTFSRRNDFHVPVMDGSKSQVVGLNDGAMQGGAVPLAGVPGAVIDLGPAELTGRRSGDHRWAEGPGAHFYCAPPWAAGYSRQNLHKTYVDNQGKIDASTTASSSVALYSKEKVKYGLVRTSITRATADAAPVVKFGHFFPLAINGIPVRNLTVTAAEFVNSSIKIYSACFFLRSYRYNLKNIRISPQGKATFGGESYVHFKHEDQDISIPVGTMPGFLGEYDLLKLYGEGEEKGEARDTALAGEIDQAQLQQVGRERRALRLSKGDPLGIFTAGPIHQALFQKGKAEYITDLILDSRLEVIDNDGGETIPAHRIKGEAKKVKVTVVAAENAQANEGTFTADSPMIAFGTDTNLTMSVGELPPGKIKRTSGENTSKFGYVLLTHNSLLRRLSASSASYTVNKGREDDTKQAVNEEGGTLANSGFLTTGFSSDMVHSLENIRVDTESLVITGKKRKHTRPIIRANWGAKLSKFDEDISGPLEKTSMSIASVLDFAHGDYSLTSGLKTPFVSPGTYPFYFPIFPFVAAYIDFAPGASWDLSLASSMKFSPGLFEDRVGKITGDVTGGVSVGVSIGINGEFLIGPPGMVGHLGLGATGAIKATVSLQGRIDGEKKADRALPYFKNVNLDITFAPAFSLSTNIHGGVKFGLWKYNIFEYSLFKWDLVPFKLGYRTSYSINDNDLGASSFSKLNDFKLFNAGMLKANNPGNCFNLNLDEKVVAQAKIAYDSNQDAMINLNNAYNRLNRLFLVSQEYGPAMGVDETAYKQEIEVFVQIGKQLEGNRKGNLETMKKLEKQFDKASTQLKKKKTEMNQHQKKLDKEFIKHEQALIDQFDNNINVDDTTSKTAVKAKKQNDEALASMLHHTSYRKAYEATKLLHDELVLTKMNQSYLIFRQMKLSELIKEQASIRPDATVIETFVTKLRQILDKQVGLEASLVGNRFLDD